MFHSLAARAYLMVVDHHIRRTDAIEWVTRRLPVQFRPGYQRRLFDELRFMG